MMYLAHEQREIALPLEELIEFVRIHAHMHEIPPARLEGILARIESATGDMAGAWPVEWSRVGQQLAARGKPLEAARCYSLGRFPYVDGPSRQIALKRCIESFYGWVHRQRKVERLLLRVGDRRVPAYGANLMAEAPALVLMGGIVSLKEQWSQFLKAELLSMPIVALDFPGTGESPFSYGQNSPEQVAAVLDSALKRVGAERCVVFASSFSGAIFAKVAMREPRIMGLVMHSSPLHHFFLDRTWWVQVPATTKLGLAATMKLPLHVVEHQLAQLAVSREVLAALRPPVVYIASLQDELVPAADWQLIEELVPAGRVIGFDDVHAAPNHTRQAGLEIMSAVLEMTGRKRTAIAAVIGLMRRMGKRR